MHMFARGLLSVFLTLLAVGCVTAQGGGDAVRIPTGDGITGYHEILAGKEPRPFEITARVFAPAECDGAGLPAVIIQHGSGNPNVDWYPRLARALKEEGIVAIVPNSHSPRGIRETGTNQAQLSKANRVYDTFSVFRYVQTHPCVDPERIGLTGYSFGGVISIDSVESALADRLGGGRVYKATLPVYPSCQGIFEVTRPTNTKVHMLLGEADDYTPASYCLDSIDARRASGWDIEATVFEGAHHGFNRTFPVRRLPNNWAFGDCGVFLIGEDGYEVSVEHGASTEFGWTAFANTLVERCARRGPSFGGSPALSQKTLDFTVAYFKENL
ncbi:MAG: dienelactone hydrolase family protein [Alphaproteobacteria bacterium]|nr:dienelactone hydrolase family protein [Alphaproteobacteria bacterium]